MTDDEAREKYEKLTPELREQFKELARKLDEGGLMDRDHPLRSEWEVQGSGQRWQKLSKEEIDQVCDNVRELQQEPKEKRRLALEKAWSDSDKSPGKVN